MFKMIKRQNFAYSNFFFQSKNSTQDGTEAGTIMEILKKVPFHQLRTRTRSSSENGVICGRNLKFVPKAVSVLLVIKKTENLKYINRTISKGWSSRSLLNKSADQRMKNTST